MIELKFSVLKQNKLRFKKKIMKDHVMIIIDNYE